MSQVRKAIKATPTDPSLDAEVLAPNLPQGVTPEEWLDWVAPAVEAVEAEERDEGEADDFRVLLAACMTEDRVRQQLELVAVCAAYVQQRPGDAGARAKVERTLRGYQEPPGSRLYNAAKQGAAEMRAAVRDVLARREVHAALCAGSRVHDRDEAHGLALKQHRRRSA